MMAFIPSPSTSSPTQTTNSHSLATGSFSTTTSRHNHASKSFSQSHVQTPSQKINHARRLTSCHMMVELFDGGIMTEVTNQVGIVTNGARNMNMMDTTSFSLGSDDYAVFSTLPSILLNEVPAEGMIPSSTDIPQSTFEPQVNAPALGSFLFIAVVFSLLQIRINQVGDAASRREEALKQLRKVKSAQLSTIPSTSDEADASSSSTIPITTTAPTTNDDSAPIKAPSTSEVKAALQAYEDALKEELNLRTIIPGIRIVAPNDAQRREEDIAAAKQFLGWDLALEDDQDVESTKVEGTGKEESAEEYNKRLLLQSRRRFDGEEKSASTSSEGEGFGNGAKAILLTVALSQILLLVVLSFDPMTANNVFTDINGPPPSDMPLSSWSSN